MDQSYIMPFVRSVQNVFETMLQLPVQVGTPTLSAHRVPRFDVTGIIAMSGDVQGHVMLSFPTETAQRVVSLFTGQQVDPGDDDFADAIGELVNMISGGAKAQFMGKRVTISCPSVVVGADHQVFGAKGMVTINMPCSSDCGEFALEVVIKAGVMADGGNQGQASHQARAATAPSV